MLQCQHLCKGGLDACSSVLKPSSVKFKDEDEEADDNDGRAHMSKVHELPGEVHLRRRSDDGGAAAAACDWGGGVGDHSGSAGGVSGAGATIVNDASSLRKAEVDERLPPAFAFTEPLRPLAFLAAFAAFSASCSTLRSSSLAAFSSFVTSKRIHLISSSLYLQAPSESWKIILRQNI